MSFRRIAGISGLVVFVLSVLTGVLGGDTPLAGDSVEDIRSYLAEDQNMHKAGLVFSVLILPFAAVFFAGLFHKIRESDRAHNGAWAIAAAIGGVLLGAAAGIGDTILAALLLRGGEGLDDSTLRALWDAQMIGYSSTGVAITVLVVAPAIPTLRHKIWPMWHGILGLIVGVAGLLTVISLVSDSNGGSALGFLGFIGLALWLLATSILMIVDKDAETAAA